MIRFGSRVDLFLDPAVTSRSRWTSWCAAGADRRRGVCRRDRPAAPPARDAARHRHPPERLYVREPVLRRLVHRRVVARQLPRRRMVRHRGCRARPAGRPGRTHEPHRERVRRRAGLAGGRRLVRSSHPRCCSTSGGSAAASGAGCCRSSTFWRRRCGSRGSTWCRRGRPSRTSSASPPRRRASRSLPRTPSPRRRSSASTWDSSRSPQLIVLLTIVLALLMVSQVPTRSRPRSGCGPGRDASSLAAHLVRPGGRALRIPGVLLLPAGLALIAFGLRARGLSRLARPAAGAGPLMRDDEDERRGSRLRPRRRAACGSGCAGGATAAAARAWRGAL